jgi:hypothetical protein
MATTDSPNLNLPYILAAQAQKHVTHNEAVRMLDAIVQLSVRDRDLAAPPPAPADGDRHIVAAAASGAWTGKSGEIAAYQDGAWAFYTPREGWTAWIADEDKLLAFNGSSWVDAGTFTSVPLLGINARRTRPTSSPSRARRSCSTTMAPASRRSSTRTRPATPPRCCARPAFLAAPSLAPPAMTICT